MRLRVENDGVSGERERPPKTERKGRGRLRGANKGGAEQLWRLGAARAPHAGPAGPGVENRPFVDRFLGTSARPLIDSMRMAG